MIVFRQFGVYESTCFTFLLVRRRVTAIEHTKLFVRFGTIRIIRLKIAWHRKD